MGLLRAGCLRVGVGGCARVEDHGGGGEGEEGHEGDAVADAADEDHVEDGEVQDGDPEGQLPAPEDGVWSEGRAQQSREGGD